LPIAIHVQVVHVAMMTVQVAHAVSIPIVRRVRVVMMIVHQRVAVSEIVQIVRHARAAMTIVQPVVAAQVPVVHHRVVASVIAIRVQVVHVAMMIVRVAHVVSMIVQRARKPMRSVVPIRCVHAQVADVTIAMQHRATIINKSVGMMKVQHVHHVVDRVVVTTMLQSIWSATRSAHQHQLLHT
jgi:hypothetical protein